MPLDSVGVDAGVGVEVDELVDVSFVDALLADVLAEVEDVFVLLAGAVPADPPPQEASIKVASVAQERARMDPNFNTALNMATIQLMKGNFLRCSERNLLVGIALDK